MTFAETIDALTIDDLVAAGSLKWTAHPGAIGAWVAEMDFGLAEPIRAALHGLDARTLYGYPSAAITTGLREATAAYQERRHGWRVDPAHVYPISDVLHGLGLVLDNYVPAGTPVVLLTPAYMPFLTIPPAFGRPVRQVPMVQSASGDWTLDLDALGAALSPGSLFVLANPVNPVGRVLTRGELVAISEVVEASGARVYADEIHAPLVFGEHRHVPYAAVSDAAAAHSITAVAACKAWNLAGLKCAQLILTNDADVALWRRQAGRRAAEASNPGMVAATAAYTEGGAWLADALAYLDVNRRVVAAELPAALPGVRLNPLEGTYLQWLDCRETAVADAPHAAFLRAGVALTDGALCGEVGRGCVRMNLGLPTPLVREAIARMGSAG